MNKKILSIFALIMAISILGVSCAKDNNTTNPTPPTPPISAEDAKKVVNTGLGSLQVVPKGTSAPANVTFDLSQVEVTASGANYTASVTGAGKAGDADNTLRIDDLVKAVEDKKAGIQGQVSGLTVTSVVSTKKDSKNAIVTINYTKGNAKAAIVITFTLPAAETGGETIVYDENHYISITAIQGAFDALGTVNSAGGADKTSDNVTFGSTTITSGGFKLTAEQATGSDASTDNTDLALITEVVDKINTSFALTGAKVTAEGPNSNPSDQTEAAIKVTIALDTGYKFDTDVTTAGVTGGVVTVKIAPTSAKPWK